MTETRTNGKTEEEIEGKKAKVLELLPLLKEELGDDLIDGTKDHTLCKYLYWKCDVKRAAERYRNFMQWRKNNSWAFGDDDNDNNMDNKALLLSKDDQLRRVLESQFLLAPPNVVDKKGNTVAFGRLRYNDMTDGRTPEDIVRAIMYTMDRSLERESTLANGFTIFHDMKDLTRNNVHIGIPKLIVSAIIGHFPIRISNMYVLNAPGFFRIMFKAISLLLTKKIRERIHFVDSIDEIYNVIDKDLLLEEHGGKNNFNVKEWIHEQMERENNGTIESITDQIVLSS